MENIPHASIVGSLMYAQTCARPDISFAVGMLGRYQSNPGLDHWKDAKKVLRYLQGTKDHMLTYKRSNHLEVIGYTDSDFCWLRGYTKVYIWLCVSFSRMSDFMEKCEAVSHRCVPLWRLSLWHALRPQFRLIGCGILFQDLELLTVLPSR